MPEYQALNGYRQNPVFWGYVENDANKNPAINSPSKIAQASGVKVDDLIQK